MEIGQLDTSFPQAQKCFLWQYSNAYNLKRLMKNDLEFFNRACTQFWEDWYVNVFNLDTADSFGLEVWGKVLGVTRPSYAPQNFLIDSNGALRFYNATTNTWHSIWLSGTTPRINVESNPPANISYIGQQVPDVVYRRLLKAYIFLLHSNYSVTDINKYLAYLFPQGAYVVDNLDMTMEIVFQYTPSEIDLTVITIDTFAPRPAGVLLNNTIRKPDEHTFGFEQNELATWTDSTQDMPPVPDGFGTLWR